MSRGDHLVVGRGLYTHHGIDIGDGTVVHYSGLADGLSAGPVERVSLADFCGGHTPRIRPHPKAKWSRNEVAERALDRVGESSYHLVWCNCESFCQWAHTGKEWSLQAVGVAAVGGLAIAGVAVVGIRGWLGRRVVACAGAACIGAVVATPQIVSRAWSEGGLKSALGGRGNLSLSSAG